MGIAIIYKRILNIPEVWLGRLLGVLTIVSIVYPIATIFLCIFLVCTTRAKLEINILIISALAALIVFYMIEVDLANDEIDYLTLVHSFPIAILGIAINRNVSKEYFCGFLEPLVVLFFVDFAFNLSILFAGNDPLGRTASVRADGQRVGGVFGHAFYSVSIAIPVYIYSLIKKNKFIQTLCSINLILIGTFRGYIYLAMLVIANFLRSATQRIFAAIAIPITIILLTGITVSDGLFPGRSGNSMRLQVWEESIKLLPSAQLVGGDYRESPFPAGTPVTLENLRMYNVTESSLLSDILWYGYILFILRIIFLVTLYHTMSGIKKYQLNQFDLVMLFIPSILFVDYALLGISSNVLISTLFAMCIAHYLGRNCASTLNQ